VGTPSWNHVSKIATGILVEKPTKVLHVLLKQVHLEFGQTTAPAPQFKPHVP
jgi:hypothetical protein